MKAVLLFALFCFFSDSLYAQLQLRTTSVGVNTIPSPGKTLDIKGSNGAQIRLNNSGEPSTSIEFSNNNVRKGFIETNSLTNEFRIVSETTGQSFKIYTLGVERLSISSDGIITMPNGVKFGGTSPQAGSFRWTGSAFEGYDGTVWKPFTIDSAQDKIKKTMSYLENDLF